MVTRAAIYRRISDDREGDELGVTRQQEDLLQRAHDRGYVVIDEYMDNDISASAKAKKERPDYKRLLADAKAGKFDVILAYTSSRITRRPRENEDLIELGQYHGIKFEYIRSPSFDLNTADGRQVARMLAANDAAEAERIGERVTRRRLQIAQNGGDGGGPRPFGWESKTGALVPVEARMIRDAVHHILRDGYINEIVDKWNATEIRAKSEKWHRTAVRDILMRPRLAGISIYRGEPLLDERGEYVRGKWEAILDDDTWLAVCAKLGQNKKTQPYRSFLLSGTLRCECGVPMYGNGRGTTRTGHSYVCQKARGGCGSTISGSVDLLVEKLVEKKLGTLVDIEVAQEEWPDQERLGLVEAQIAELWAAYRAGQVTGPMVFPEISEREAEVKELKRQKAAAAIEQLPPSDAREMWASGELAQRRAVVKRLWAGILIRPATVKGPKFDLSRVVPVDKE